MRTGLQEQALTWSRQVEGLSSPLALGTTSLQSLHAYPAPEALGLPKGALPPPGPSRKPRLGCLRP